MKFHDSPVILHKQMLEDELSAVGQNLVEFREASRQEIRFRLIMTGERMRAFDDPVDLIVYMLEKARSVALLKTLKDPSDVVFGNHNLLLYIIYASNPFARRVVQTNYPQSLARRQVWGTLSPRLARAYVDAREQVHQVLHAN